MVEGRNHAADNQPVSRLLNSQIAKFADRAVKQRRARHRLRVVDRDTAHAIATPSLAEIIALGVTIVLLEQDKSSRFGREQLVRSPTTL